MDGDDKRVQTALEVISSFIKGEQWKYTLYLFAFPFEPTVTRRVEGAKGLSLNWRLLT